MKRFFTKTGIWLLAAAATIAVALCIVSALGSGTGFLHDALGVIASPFRTAGTAVADWFTGIGDRFESVEQLQEKNAELNRRVAELEDELRKAQNAADENKDLRQLLGLRQQRTDLQFEAALSLIHIFSSPRCTCWGVCQPFSCQRRRMPLR